MDIEETANNSIPNEEINEPQQLENGYPNQGNEEKKEFWLFRMLRAETGEGSIESYNQHPLNRDSNRNISQIIRGFTGMLGNLNYALIDILLGSLGFYKDKNNVEDVKYSTNEDFETEHPSYQNGSPNIVNGRVQ